MDVLKNAIGNSVTLESVLCTEELKRRPSRPPDYQAENQALLALAQELTNSPASVLQKLVDIALELCRGHSSGISLLEEDGPPGGLSSRGDHFRWHAVAGQWAPLVWNTTTPRDYGPCGTVLDRNITLLFSNAHRYYAQFARVQPLLVEGLLVPFHVDGQAVGTVWVIAHDETMKFDAEDQRVLESLATFAAAAYQARLSISNQAKANQDLQAKIAELQRAEEALQQADRRKSEFLAMLAHELRNPLAPIRNAVEILARIGTADATLQWSREVIDRQVEHMTRIVDDLLDVSRLTSGKIFLHRSVLTLGQIVEHALETSRPAIDSRKQRLTIDLPPEPVYIDSDIVRLSQVLSNLLNNAAKYTDEGGEIALTARCAGDEVSITVRDTGIGIRADLLPHVFDLFMQAEQSLARSLGGLGIGLTLVRQLVEMHGGRVAAKSEGPGKGSEFTIWLPIAQGKPPDTASAAVQKVHSDISHRILIVEDNADARESLGMLLEMEGHQVRRAQDGENALKIAQEFEPEVMLLDIGLPNMDGFEVIRRLRAHAGLVQPIVIALTGYGEAEYRRRTKEAGFEHHLVKPVAPEEVMAIVASLSSSSRGLSR